ncbi:Wzz/FepE/Etk N-terminal domain-containing protein [Stenotrophomonas rhizophila]
MNNTDSRPNNTEESQEIDLRQLLGTLVDHRWWIVGITGAFFAISMAYALLSKPIYRADAIIQVESKAPSLPGLSDISQSLGVTTGSAEASTEIALITSRAVVGSAVQELRSDIKVDPSRFPLIGAFLSRRAEIASPEVLSPPKLGMTRFGWGGEVLDVFQLDVPPTMYDNEMTLTVLDAKGRYSLQDEGGATLLEGECGSASHRPWCDHPSVEAARTSWYAI